MGVYIILWVSCTCELNNVADRSVKRHEWSSSRSNRGRIHRKIRRLEMVLLDTMHRPGSDLVTQHLPAA